MAAHRRVYLSGVAGCGKSRLAAECAAARGAWLRVACAPTDPGLPYASATRVLRALREAAPDVALPTWVRRELAWLLPELGDGPPPVAEADAGERLRTAFAAAWQQLADETFDAIVLDDWHWADDASVDLWRRVRDRAAASIVAYRSAQLGPAALARMHEEVDQGHAVAVELAGLSSPETLDLVHALSGAPGGTLFARRLHAATAGNPFHLIETLHHLADQGQLQRRPGGGWRTPFDDTTDDYAELPVPASVREVVLARVRTLGDELRRLLEAASLLGDAFEARQVAGTTGLADEALVARLEHATAARLLVAEGRGFHFVHDLVRSCLVDSLSPARRQMLHARLAQRLVACGAEPALVAAQLEGSGEAAAAIAWRRRAAEQAWRAHALAEAATHWRQALADGAAGADAVDIWLALARLENRRADSTARYAALDAAVHGARDADAETRIRARLEQLYAWRSDDRVADVRAGLEALAAELAGAPVTLQVKALQLRALVACGDGRHDEAQRLDDEAIALVQALPGAVVQRADMLDTASRTAMLGGRLARAEALATRAVAAAEGAGHDVLVASALVLQGIATLYGRNDRAAALACFERARALAQRLGDVPRQRSALLNLIKCRADEGRADEAAALLAEGEALAPGFENRHAELAFAEVRYYVHYLRGDVAAAHAAAERLLAIAAHIDERQTRQSSVQLVLDLYLHTGKLDTASRLLASVGDSRGDWQHGVLQAKAAWLALARGNFEVALDRLAALDAPGAEPGAEQGAEQGAELRVEDGLVVAWVGAAAALALGDLAGARQRLAAVDIADEHVVDALAMVLVQRLELARRSGQADPAARDRAAALLPRAPALEARVLRRALDAG